VLIIKLEFLSLLMQFLCRVVVVAGILEIKVLAVVGVVEGGDDDDDDIFRGASSSESVAPAPGGTKMMG